MSNLTKLQSIAAKVTLSLSKNIETLIFKIQTLINHYEAKAEQAEGCSKGKKELEAFAQ